MSVKKVHEKVTEIWLEKILKIAQCAQANKNIVAMCVKDYLTQPEKRTSLRGKVLMAN